MKQLSHKEAASFAHAWAKRLALKPSATTSQSRVEIMQKLIKERLQLNGYSSDGVHIIAKVFDKISYGGCSHFTNRDIKAWLLLEGASAKSDLDDAVDLIQELKAIRGK